MQYVELTMRTVECAGLMLVTLLELTQKPPQWSRGTNKICNTFSMSKLISKGLNVLFNSLRCVLRANNDEILVVASLKSNLY